MENKLLLSITDAAKALSCSRGTIYNLFADGRIRRVKIGTATRIPMDSLQGYVASLDASAN